MPSHKDWGITILLLVLSLKISHYVFSDPPGV